MLLEAKSKQCFTNDDSDWMILDVNVSTYASWNFDSFDFRLDGIIYTESSVQWLKEIKTAQLWARLNR